MSLFVKRGNTFRVTPNENLDVRTALPAENYTVAFDNNTNEFFLEQIESFDINHKLYGDVIKNRDRILNTFASRTSSTGVMLSGEKGSGKTLLAKAICIKAKEEDIPTIIINHAWFGDQFNTFIQNFSQPIIILFDEFEKVYCEKEQKEAILTLFDGVYQSKKMFICTCNDKFKVDDNMRNRPGRIYYMIDFSELELEFIREYCEENLINKEYISTVCNLSSIFSQFNFDMLKAMVEEMNRYNESPQDVIKIINTKPEFTSPVLYDIEYIPNREIKFYESGYSKEFKGNPLMNPVHVSYDYYDGEEIEYKASYFNPSDIISIDLSGKVLYKNSANERLILTKKEEKKAMHYFAF